MNEVDLRNFFGTERKFFNCKSLRRTLVLVGILFAHLFYN